MFVEGTWQLVIDTPIGKQRTVVELSTKDGALHGVARDQRHGEEVELTDLVLDGNQLTWKQSITKPMRLNLTFDVTVEGDQIAGRSKAGRLPNSKVAGHRVPPDSTTAARRSCRCGHERRLGETPRSHRPGTGRWEGALHPAKVAHATMAVTIGGGALRNGLEVRRCPR